MKLIIKSMKPLLLAVAFTLLFSFLIPLYRDFWAFPLSFGQVVFVRPKWIEHEECLSLQSYAGPMRWNFMDAAGGTAVEN